MTRDNLYHRLTDRSTPYLPVTGGRMGGDSTERVDRSGDLTEGTQ